jgi:hypothetical protein
MSAKVRLEPERTIRNQVVCPILAQGLYFAPLGGPGYQAPGPPERGIPRRTAAIRPAQGDHR